MEYSFDFKAIAEKIKGKLSAEFPKLNISDFYPRTEQIPSELPSIVFELAAWEKANEQPASGELVIETNWEARVLVPLCIVEANPLLARQVALKLSGVVHGENFGIPKSLPAKFTRADFEGADDAITDYESMLCEWSQIFVIGKNHEVDDGVVPSKLIVRKEIK